MATPARVDETMKAMEKLQTKINNEAFFHVQSTIRRLITEESSRNKNVGGVTIVSGSGSASSIFHGLVKAISSYNNEKVHDMRLLILRDDKTIQGLVWEMFCRDWLRMDNKYVNAWLLNEVPSEILRECGLCRLDNGIDLIAELSSAQPAVMYNTSKVRDIEKKQGILPGSPIKSKYVAIQCKFRAPNKDGIGAALTWKMLDTFTGLCSMTGPWVRGIVMTNSKGVGPRVPRKAKEERNDEEAEDVRKDRKTVLHDRFTTMAFCMLNKTEMDHWMRMAGTGEAGRRLDEDTEATQPTPIPTPLIPPTNTTTNIVTAPTPVPDSVTGQNKGISRQKTSTKSTRSRGTKSRGFKGTGRGGKALGHIVGGDTDVKTPDQLREARLAHYTPNTIDTE